MQLRPSSHVRLRQPSSVRVLPDSGEGAEASPTITLICSTLNDPTWHMMPGGFDGDSDVDGEDEEGETGAHGEDASGSAHDDDNDDDDDGDQSDDGDDDDASSTGSAASGPVPGTPTQFPRALLPALEKLMQAEGWIPLKALGEEGLMLCSGLAAMRALEVK